MVSRSAFFIITALCLAASAALLSLPGAAFGQDPHDFSDIGCDSCHREIEREKVQGKSDLREDIDAQCVICHGSCPHGKKHTGNRGIAQSMKISLPLDRSGKMGCATCHNPHMAYQDGTTSTRTVFLRINNLKRELCLNCHRSGSRTGRLDVSFPPSGAVFRRAYLPLLGRAENLDATTHLTVTLNGSSFPLKLQDSAFFTRLRLTEGTNTIELAAERDILWRGEVFGMSPGEAGISYDKIVDSHGIETREECLGCHVKDSMSQLIAPEPKLCYRCHENMDSKRFLHGPVAVGQCISCHDPHGGRGQAHLKAEGQGLCLGCHTLGEVRSHKGWNMARADVPCLDCHDPHQSDSRYLGRVAWTPKAIPR